MKINKYKKIGKNKYKIFFDNSQIVLYDDIILKYELLTKDDIDLNKLDEIIEKNRWYEAYDNALSYIETKMRNKSEIVKYLQKKEYSSEIINYVIDRLNELNLLDDKKYLIAFINDKVNLTNDGPYKIKKSLLDLDFSEEDINNYLYKIDEEVWLNKLKKQIERRKKLMKTKSYFSFINKMKNDLYNMGYDKDIIEKELSNIEYDSDALEIDYKKALKKYDDRSKVINYLLRKGYTYEEINKKLNNY